MKNNVSSEILESISEEFEEGKLLSANDLFNAYIDIEDSTITDLADKWNGCTGTPDEVRQQRIKLINPAVVAFVDEYKDSLKAKWDEFSYIMTDANFHTPLIAIEKELEKYE